MAFNGCKMTHVWVLENNLYTDASTSEGTLDALHRGKMFNKIDGSNHCMWRGEHNWILYGRYDDKKGTLNPDNLPTGYREPVEGKNAQIYTTTVRHAYFYKLRERPDPAVKLTKATKINKMLYDIVDANTARFDKLAQIHNVDFFTCEAVGTKFGKAPGLDFPVGLCLHVEQVLPVYVNRSQDAIREYLGTVCTEGVIVQYDGQCWKIRSNCFDKDCEFERAKKSGVVSMNQLPIVNLMLPVE